MANNSTYILPGIGDIYNYISRAFRNPFGYTPTLSTPPALTPSNAQEATDINTGNLTRSPSSSNPPSNKIVTGTPRPPNTRLIGDPITGIVTLPAQGQGLGSLSPNLDAQAHLAKIPEILPQPYISQGGPSASLLPGSSTTYAFSGTGTQGDIEGQMRAQAYLDAKYGRPEDHPFNPDEARLQDMQGKIGLQEAKNVMAAGGPEEYKLQIQQKTLDARAKAFQVRKDAIAKHYAELEVQANSIPDPKERELALGKLKQDQDQEEANALTEVATLYGGTQPKFSTVF